MNREKVVKFSIAVVIIIPLCFAVINYKAVFVKVNTVFAKVNTVFVKNNTDASVIKKNKDIKSNKAIVYFLNGQVVEIVSGIERDNTLSVPDHLIIPPDRYHFFHEKKSYLLNKEGLYRFVQPGGKNSQKIVYKNNIDALLSAISWIVTHGVSDDGLEIVELTEKAQKTKLFLTCGNISKWSFDLLSSLGVKSRIVGGITLAEFNDYDNGHRLLEVWRDEWKKWVVYDLDNNSYFTDKINHVPLNVDEFSSRVADGDYDIVLMSLDIRVDISGFRSSTGYDYSFFSEAMIVDIKRWYARVMQVALIYDDYKYNFSDITNKDRLVKYRSYYKHMDRAVFMEKFYDE